MVTGHGLKGLRTSEFQDKSLAVFLCCQQGTAGLLSCSKNMILGLESQVLVNLTWGESQESLLEVQLCRHMLLKQPKDCLKPVSICSHLNSNAHNK